MGLVTVASRAHRILKNLAEYRAQDFFPEGVSGSPNEEMIGIYQSEEDQPVMITNKGFYLKSKDRWEFFGYKQIQGVDTPIEKIDVKGFHLILSDHKKTWLPISGVKNNRFYDAFEFIRFVNRVIEDQKEQ